MSALKWSNTDFDRQIIKIVETRVEGEERRPMVNPPLQAISIQPSANTL